VIPSWAISLAVHAALFAALTAVLPGFRGGIVGDRAGDFRTVGIYVGSSGSGEDAREAAATSPATPPAHPKTSQLSPTDPIPDSLGAELSKPNKPPSVIGLSRPPSSAKPFEALTALPPSVSAGLSLDSAQAAGVGRAEGGSRGSLGSTPFFGIWDAGGTFVYVIDGSSSMFAHNAAQAAKNELLASLRTLKKSQRFQIVFYSTEQKWLSAPGNASFGYFTATDANRRLAAQFVGEVQPDGGTLHVPALSLALRLAPDVIFFLTDGGEPGLTPRELAELRAKNQARSRIHCVQFGVGPEVASATAASFLRKLAAQNGGDYAYRDVTALERRSDSR
jgi:Ca-activated chloride channel family protein